jgi:hypothetical protein
MDREAVSIDEPASAFDDRKGFDDEQTSEAEKTLDGLNGFVMVVLLRLLERLADAQGQASARASPRSTRTGETRSTIPDSAGVRPRSNTQRRSVSFPDCRITRPKS